MGQGNWESRAIVYRSLHDISSHCLWYQRWQSRSAFPQIVWWPVNIWVWLWPVHSKAHLYDSTKQCVCICWLTSELKPFNKIRLPWPQHCNMYCIHLITSFTWPSIIWKCVVIKFSYVIFFITKIDKTDPLSGTCDESHNIYYPFASQAEWELAEWLLFSSLPESSVNEFLHLDWVGTIDITQTDHQWLYRFSAPIPYFLHYTGLECILGIFHNGPLLPCSSPKGLWADLEWWIKQFWQPIITRAISQPVSLYNSCAFSDVSSVFGITITIGDRWRAWHLIPDWKTLIGDLPRMQLKLMEQVI